MKRCAWAENDPLLQSYHDEEWGVPEYDSRALWEKLMLDGFQAGLSWLIVLRKRDAFRKAFKGFEPETVAAFKASDVRRLVKDPGIIRSKAKIEATIGNAPSLPCNEGIRRGFFQIRLEFCRRKTDSKRLEGAGTSPGKNGPFRRNFCCLKKARI